MRTLCSTAIWLVGASLFAAPAVAQDAAPDAASATTAKADAGQAVAPAAEEEEPAKPFSLDVTLSGVSDYRFRGISLSNKKPAFQPSITLTHESGFHVGTWLSNTADNGGDDLEIDLIGGFGKTLGPIDFDINATYYLYPGAHDLDYVEFIGTAGHEFGALTLGATFAYTPRQDDAAPSRGIYAAVNAAYAVPNTPVSLTASYGLEDNAFYSHKRDWSLGVSADVAGFTVGAAYVDTGHTGGDRLGKPTVVVSLSRSFEAGF